MATRQYIGARYVPKFADPIAWVKENSYEALTIVTYLNNSYTSKKPVPANTEITDTNYWVVTGNYNAQVEEYRQETIKVANELKDETKAREKDIAKLKNSNYYDGRNVLILGDSLSDENLSMSSPNWVTYFRTKVVASGGTVTNYSNSGRSLSEVRTDNLISNLSNIPSDSYTDIVLFLGINDWASSATRSVFMSACTAFASWVYENHPLARVYVVTPVKANKTSFNQNVPILFYRNMLLHGLCASYNFEVIDAFNNAPNYNANITTSKDLYTTDGLHFKPYYAEMFCNFMFDVISSGGTGVSITFNVEEKRNIFSGINNSIAYIKDDGTISLYLDLTNYVPQSAIVNLGDLPEFARPAIRTSRTFYYAVSGTAKTGTIIIDGNGKVLLVFDDTTQITDSTLYVDFNSYEKSNVNIV